MIIICETKATEAQVRAVENKIREAGLTVHRSDGVEHTILGVVGGKDNGVRRVAAGGCPFGVEEAAVARLIDEAVSAVVAGDARGRVGDAVGTTMIHSVPIVVIGKSNEGR